MRANLKYTVRYKDTLSLDRTKRRVRKSVTAPPPTFANTPVAGKLIVQKLSVNLSTEEIWLVNRFGFGFHAWSK